MPLIDAGMGSGAVVTDRTIDVHIAALRKKLDAAGGWIHTVACAGTGDPGLGKDDGHGGPSYRSHAGVGNPGCRPAGPLLLRMRYNPA